MLATLVDGPAVLAALDEADALDHALATMDVSRLTLAELLVVCDRMEARRCRQPGTEHRLLAELRSRATAKELGAKSWADVLSTRMRISTAEAKQRLTDAEVLGPRTALTGEVLAVLAVVAAAQAQGSINDEHLRILRKFFKELPHWVDVGTREIVETHLVGIAQGAKPEDLRKAADQLMVMIDQDGPMPDEREHARKRGVSIGPQGRDGMSRIWGWLDPEARATLDPTLAKLAAPGMCHPDDDTPCVDGSPTEDLARRDDRSQPQRNHDALKAMGRALLASGELGQHNGLPATIIVTTTLQELQSGTGVAHTGGGTLLPMRDVIRLAAQAHHYLVIFDDHTEEVLYLGRAKRFASPGQRIVLYAKDRGCTRPGCTAPGYWCEVHHRDGDFSQGGRTDINELTLACPPDNRLATESGWTTRTGTHGRTEWIPPPALDTGQARVNHFHHPERYLLPEDEDDDEGDNQQQAGP